MFKNIYLDHFYNDDEKFKFQKSLGKRGFVLAENEVEHPGHAFCRFIHINEKQYLEFVYIKKDELKYTYPGLSLGYHNDLEKYSKKLSKSSLFDTSFHHKNYNWKENSKDRLPGWNFISFTKTGIRTIYTWFTEYEPLASRKKLKRKVKHPNTVYGIYGVELELNPKGEEFYSTILSKKIKPEFQFTNGDYFFANKTTKASKFKYIVLKCKNIKKAKELSKPDEIIKWRGHDALVLKNKSQSERMWDLLIIQA